MERIDFGKGWNYSSDNGIEWEAVTLPHDAMLHGKRSAKSAGTNANAFFEGGVYVYEKEFDAPEEWADKSVTVEFGGVYRNAKVFLNGVLIAERPYGYTTFAVCLDGNLKYGETNLLRVEADNSQLPNSRWYSGGGIYRPVALWIGGKSHIAWQGVRITTKSAVPAAIAVDVETVGNGTLTVEILDGDTVVAAATGAHTEMTIPAARLWSDEHPYLYTCRVTMENEDEVCDVAEERFGVRTIVWSTGGLLINGVETLLRGACIHHDNGVLGACSYPEAEERRIRKLKEFGFNAIRMAHHPAGREVLDACDKLGMYVMDEAFDMWYEHKNKYDYASDFEDWHEHDLRAMVAKDYNHPSVIMYSIGNEVSEPREAKGLRVAAEMLALLHKEDRTRPVTAGINLMILYMTSLGKGVFHGEDEAPKPEEKKPAKESASGSLFFNLMMQKLGAGLNNLTRIKPIDDITSPILDMLDVAGYNYASGRYPMEGKKHPNRIIVGSETFPQDIAKNWKMVEKYPYLIGDFMWTGWDYIGEAAIGAWNYEGVNMGNVPYPWLLADTGAFDITGYPGAEAYLAKTVWQHEKKPYIGVRPPNHPKETLSVAIWRGTNAIDSWSWSGCEGNEAVVEIYADAHSVELVLNGKTVGRKTVRDCKAIFKTAYAHGTLTAVSFDRKGAEVGRSTLRSAETETHITIRPEGKATAGELLYVDILLADKNGVVESNTDAALAASVENGELLGFGSALPRTEETFYSGTYTTRYGRAQAVIRPSAAGDLKITVTGQNGESVTETVSVKEGN